MLQSCGTDVGLLLKTIGECRLKQCNVAAYDNNNNNNDLTAVCPGQPG